ncbi:uncharacterized protein M6B38_385940 [Iris pallida]|uniref:Integrase catalytic domain-containing protein n=1 Tax=Iris pallida TaxID=29817 RepID=A0AAX6G2J3_IRIPA|nr:uncharacterized protein M6B38_385940 [Iris pallida]
MGYYWPTMMADAIDYARKCKACQVHADFIHQPSEFLHPTVASWPFEAWGMDIVGPITPPSSRGHRFILAITDYFSKRAEVVPLAEVKTSNVISFLKHHVIYRFGLPRRIIHDNGPQFASHAFYRFCDKHRIQNIASTPYKPGSERVGRGIQQNNHQTPQEVCLLQQTRLEREARRVFMGVPYYSPNSYREHTILSSIRE